MNIYDPGPRSRSPPPMVWSPTPRPRIPIISMVFTAFWMQNLIFPYMNMLNMNMLNGTYQLYYNMDIGQDWVPL